jgi:hypothetical protein
LKNQGQAATAATESPYQRQRRFSRHRLDVRIEVSAFREGATIAFWGRTSEVGVDGVGATLTGELALGEVVWIEFPVAVPPYFVKVRGIVRYTQGLHCGFEFLALTEQQRNTLLRACEVLEPASNLLI